MICIIVGVVLIVLQLMADLGNLSAGGLTYFSNVPNFETFIYDLVGFIAYSSIGILGVVLLIIGIREYRKRKDGNTNEETIASKATTTSNDEKIEEITVAKVETPPIETTAVDTSSSETTETERKTHTMRFCSRCGNIIDPTSKKCTGCGKQYFKGIKAYLDKVTIIITVLIFLLATSGTLNIIQLVQNQENTNKIKELEEEIIEKRHLWLQELAENITLQNKVDFYEKHVVIVADDGTNLYHKYGCDECDTSLGFWAYNLENAKHQGYVPHKECCS